MTTGAFYGYFSSKEALFASIVEPHAIALIAEMFVSEVSADRIREIYETPAAEGAETFNPDGHDIVFDNVSFSYGNGAVLNGVSFTAKEGEVTALVGPSEAGKSTAARLAARLWDVTGGTIRVGTLISQQSIRKFFSAITQWYFRMLCFLMIQSGRISG